MGQQQYTQTPYRVGKHGGCVVADTPVPLTGSDHIDYYGGHLVAESITPSNAAFIVRACNAHDELVNALREALRILEGTNAHKPYGDAGHKAILGARAALAKVSA